jgi:hypothetical protein
VREIRNARLRASRRRPPPTPRLGLHDFHMEGTAPRIARARRGVVMGSTMDVRLSACGRS